MVKHWLALVGLFCLIGTQAIAQNERRAEQILGFHSIIAVNVDASIDITETISVYANREKIIHGIVRRLPIESIDSNGITHITRYQIRKVLLNGQPTEYHIKNRASQLAIYIGSSDVVLKPDIYDYTISYHVNNAINFFSHFDELYWNITGNEWEFPILKVQADINLPEGTNLLSYAAYTGAKGDKGTDFTALQSAAHLLSFITTRALQSGEGLTVAISWPKGIIQAPTFLSRLTDDFTKSQVILMEITLLIVGYSLFVWYRYGRDPRKGTIVPLFEPPNNLSPAAIRYITRMGFDMKTFTVAIISMATKGWLSIEDKEGDYTLVRTKKENEQLAAEEKAIDSTLFSAAAKLTLDNSNQSLITQAMEAATDSLKKNYEDSYFINNLKYLFPAWLLTLLALVVAIFSADDPSSATFMIFWLFFWSIACIFLVKKVIVNVRRILNYFSFGTLFATLFALLFAIPFLVALVIVLYVATELFPIFTLPFLLSIITINAILYQLIKAPTVLGRKVMDEIEGFKLFLATTERYRLEMNDSMEKTKQMFERFLPYALALNIENQWGEAFNEFIRAASEAPETYQPSWYTGTHWTPSTLSTFPIALSTGISSALASSSSNSSGSGSFGGGSSGGGGGGGGGGGW